MHPTRAGESISVTISEAGFEAMKNDPEYEAWVLNDLQVGWSQPDKWSGICGGAFSTIYYGASKEECHAEMWSAGYNNGNGGMHWNFRYFIVNILLVFLHCHIFSRHRTCF